MKNDDDEMDNFTGEDTEEKEEPNRFIEPDQEQTADPDDDLSDDLFDNDELDNEPRQNFVTGIPEDEAVFERKSKTEKSSSGLKKTVALTVTAVILLMAVALFFIFRGKTGSPETANVKDNSSKFGVNTSSVDSNPNFAKDYANRYSDPNSNSATSDVNANTASPNGLGTVGGNITTTPAPPADGGIFNPQSSAVLLPPPVSAPPPIGGGSYGGGSSSGGSNSKPVETATIIPGKSTQVVEVKPQDPYRPSSDLRSGAGGLNEQVSLYFYDPPLQPSETGRLSKIQFEKGSGAAHPDFGTVLPVKILGRLHTLGTGALARLELTRPVQGNWGTLPRGTLFVGRVSGGEAKRLFVSLLGYIEPNSNRLVTIGGDLQGQDGALGVVGDLKSVGSRWNKVFGELYSTAKQIGSAYLLGRSGGSGTVINNGQLSQLPNTLDGSATLKYVLVEAGSQGYIVINELPPAIESDERLASGGRDPQLTDEDILKMIQTQSPQDVERVLPQLSPRGQQIARGAIGK